MAKPSRNIIVGLLLILAFLFGWQSAQMTIPKAMVTNDTVEENTSVSPTPVVSDSYKLNNIDLSLYWTVWKILEQEYIDESAIDNQEMIYGSIKGMVASLEDPYTVFMTPEETQQFQNSLNGTLEGIGAELTIKDYNLVIVSPLKNSPAEKAGLLPGDIIYKIDGEVASEMTLFEAIFKIRGEKGTKVTLTIIRENVPEPFEVEIERATIELESVTLEDLGDGLEYISINQFSDDTKKEFSEKVGEILLKEPKGVILDLRFNGGGYLDIAVDILSELIVEKRNAVTIARRNEEDNEDIFVTGNARLAEVPLVVLVNNGSASASEIVAGAIQDYKRGVVIGEQTFGKGNVQEVEMLGDGSSLRLTIARWLTPNGRNIDKVGIVPDIEVEITEEDVENERDAQLERAKQYLTNL